MNQWPKASDLKKSIKPYGAIGCSDSMKKVTFPWKMRNKFSYLWKMRNEVLIFVKNEKASSHFREKWETQFSFSWKMRKPVLICVKNEKKSSHFREKWHMSTHELLMSNSWAFMCYFSRKWHMFGSIFTKKGHFWVIFMKNYPEMCHFRENWPKHVSFLWKITHERSWVTHE